MGIRKRGTDPKEGPVPPVHIIHVHYVTPLDGWEDTQNILL